MTLSIDEKRAHGQALIDALNARDFDAICRSDYFDDENAEHHDVDPDRSLTVFTVSGRAKASGVPMRLHTAQIWTWEDGKMVRNDSFTDPREAFEAAGLPYEPSTRST